MARPRSKELTDRELVVMRVFWDGGPATADEARERLTRSNTDLAYVTVANVVRALADKGFLEQTNEMRPYCYRAARSFDEVSTRIVGDLVKRVFDGSHEKLLAQIIEQRRLTKREREYLRDLLDD